jgi:hypothetical protein
LSSYLWGLDTNILNSDIGGLTPGANSGVALTGFSYGWIDGAFASRTSITRATGGTQTNITAEKANSRSRASDAQAVDQFSSAPTPTGNNIISIGFSGSSSRSFHRHWTIPNPRYPIYADPSGNKWYATTGSNTINACRTFYFREPTAESYSPIRGRRNRNNGYFNITDYSTGFGGGSTSPKNEQGSSTRNYVQVADWPASQFQPSNTIFLNLLNGTADQSLDADSNVVTITAPVATVGSGNANVTATNNQIDITAPVATLSTGGGAQNITATANVVNITAPVSSLTIGNSSLSALNNLVTVTAPVGSLSANVNLSPGANIVTISNPNPTVTSGLVNISALANVINITAPLATISWWSCNGNFLVC